MGCFFFNEQMLLVLTGNSEITASIPENKLSRHRGCENEESSNPTRQADLGGWWVEGVPNPMDLAEAYSQATVATEQRREP